MAGQHVIVFDGLDGCGKGTQINLAEEMLKNEGVDYIRTREPGGCPEAEKIRTLLLSDRGAMMSPDQQFSLFWEARELHIAQTILPALEAGKLVICDRFDCSTYAFQVCGEENHHLQYRFKGLRQEVIGPVLGECMRYIIFDLPPEVAHARMQADRKRTLTHFDEKPIAYHARVREGFRKFKELPGVSNVYMVDATRAIDVVHIDVMNLFSVLDY